MHNNIYSTRNTQTITKMGLFLAIIIATGFFSIPLPFIGVPIVIQNMSIMLSGGFLGKKYGFITNAIFLFLVFIGFPLLAGGRGGAAVFLSPSFGFFIGYLLCPIVIGFILERNTKKSFVVTFLAYLIGGALFINIMGSFSIAYYSHTSLINGLKSITVFLPLDIVKAIIAAIIHQRLQHLTLNGIKND
ncbi:biotin transporter BioY [Vagococcus hydrophili]|uniref:Biotin transporter n=1 Tax=Vagococcus hydrophili TaxID=2714947 RepID=A0A6G8ARN0_9ENTE|nr:biotin transporter BioY [Vagococcus hydrophili]QIL47656.1 biotin transporter BioY [Vagococcus hydrophili]